MKTTTPFIIILLLFFISAKAQISFQEHNLTDFSTGTFSSVVLSADMDGDGDMDVIAPIHNNTIAWKENTDGQGTFNVVHIITNLAPNVTAMKVSDMDGDGDMDVVAAFYTTDIIEWYENINGLGEFSTTHFITTEGDGPESIFVADIDGDDDMDILATSFIDGEIAWYENIDGLGNFGAQNIISLLSRFPTDVRASDFDGDGDMDVLAADGFDDELIWFENTDGQGTFGDEHVISIVDENFRMIDTGDIDGDGDVDVIGTATVNNYFYWYENVNGLGDFSNPHIILSNTNSPYVSFLSDMDEDGDMDIVASFVGNTDASPKRIVWFENLDGLGNFGPQLTIGLGHLASDVVTADVNADNDLDLIVISRFERTVNWYENLDGSSDFAIKPVIFGSAFNAKVVYASDMDNDGDIDILSGSSDDKIAWYENLDGLGTFQEQQIISINAERVLSLTSCDIDGDGDNDVITGGNTLSYAVSWHENTDGINRFGLPNRLSVPGEASSADSVTCADLDGDGDMDVLYAAINNSRIAWYENLDGAGNFSSFKIISSTAFAAQSIYSTDVDNDGDMDVLCATTFNISWYENLDGLGNFSERHEITTSISQALSVYAADLDNDGDMDALSASFTDDKVAWYENLDGLGTYGEQQIISSTADGASSVFAIDLDNDGDMDVLSASFNDDTIAWYENNGSGVFSEKQIITTNADGAKSVYAADINGDGNIDVLSASSLDSSIKWYENSGSLSIPENSISSLSLYPNPTKGILNINSRVPISQIDVYSNLGQLVLSVSNGNSIDISNLSSGLYIVKVETVNGSFNSIKTLKL